MRRFQSPFLSLFLFIFLVGCRTPGPRQTPLSLEALFPESFPRIGWALQDTLSFFTRYDLHEYIDGGAELFLTYGFQKLATGTYVRIENADEYVVADVYDMGSNLNAFGVYAINCDPIAQPLQIGTAAFSDPFLLAFYKGRYFVCLTLNTPSQAAVEHIARVLASRVPGDTSPPAELCYLPEKGRVKGTLSYVPANLLGHRFLPGGMTASYEVNGTEVMAFISLFDTQRQASEAMAQYRLLVAEDAASLRTLGTLDQRTLVGQEPQHGRLLLVQHHNFLIGVRNVLDLSKASDLIERIRAQLPGGRATQESRPNNSSQ